jgi:uncharacterized membrane protein
VLGYVLALALLVGLVAFDLLDPLWLVGAFVIGIVLGLFGTSAGSFFKGGIWSSLITIIWVSVVLFNIVGFGLDTLTQMTVNTAAIAAISIVTLTVVFSVLMRAPTMQGRKIMDQIDGFKMYLETAEKERLNINGEPPMTVDRFERILPYAIALGVEKPWSNHFEAELARNAVSDVSGSYHPSWYHGSSFGSAGNAASNITNAVSAAAASMTAAMVAAQPVQASSSGFSSGGGGGGGSSGGGGGGGGGGGW